MMGKTLNSSFDNDPKIEEFMERNIFKMRFSQRVLLIFVFVVSLLINGCGFCDSFQKRKIPQHQKCVLDVASAAEEGITATGECQFQPSSDGSCPAYFIKVESDFPGSGGSGVCTMSKMSW